jgi:hypothetical protein
MRWQKLGLLFRPEEHALIGGGAGFAQSPQALVLDDRVRVYFSTRAPDGFGASGRPQFVSRVAFVDLSFDLRRVLGVNDAEVLAPGGLGAFDEHGVFPFSPLRVGSEVWAYTTGWSRRASVPVETAVGRVVSRDGGRTFSRDGDGPVLGPSPREPFLVGDAFVRHFGGRFHMWTMFGQRWLEGVDGGEAERVYKIGRAWSADGLTWEKDEGHPIIPDVLGLDECQALPSVVPVGGQYLMAFCYRHATGFRTVPGRGYRLGQAWSDDLQRWTRQDDLPAFPAEPGQWDSEMVCYPHLFPLGGRVVMLYNGNAFGRGGFGGAVLEP